MDETRQRWVRTWSASPQAPDASVLAVEPFADATLRQVVRISGGGAQLRIRFTNEYGKTPLRIGAARVSLAAHDGALEPNTERVLTFAGRPSADVPAGAPILSDPINLSLSPLSRLSISVYVPGSVETCTCHGSDLQTTWSIAGNAVAATTLPAGATLLPALVLLSAVEVLADDGAAIVVLGDSLTDGAGSTPYADRRWPDVLAERLTSSGGRAGYISNQGISGNRLLNDGFGVSALARFDRDVLATPGLGYIVVFEGADIAISFAPRDDGPVSEFLKAFPGAAVTADDLIAGYRQLIARAHACGTKIYGATLVPYGASDIFSPEGDNARQTVNTWIRTSGAFDAVLDFDAVWRDPAYPTRTKHEFLSDDNLHGNDAGYKALADSIDLSLFT